MKLILDDGRELNVTLSEEEIAKLCKKDDVMWFPKDEEETWYIDVLGNVISSNSWSKKHLSDLHKHKLGHIFKTKEEAEKHLALIEAKYKVRKRIVELHGECWIPNWSYGVTKCYIRLFKNKLDIDSVWQLKCQPNWMYLKSKELAEQLIKELEPELRLVLEE